MIETIDIKLLKNCTVMAMNRYPVLSPSSVNDTVVQSANRSEVLDYLAQMISIENEENDMKTSGLIK